MPTQESDEWLRATTVYEVARLVHQVQEARLSKLIYELQLTMLQEGLAGSYSCSLLDASSGCIAGRLHKHDVLSGRL